MATLELKNISVRFGGLLALSEISFGINSGEILGLIGPNGAGKTTIFNVLTGVYQASSGEVLFNGKSILGKRPHEIFKSGIARTFQNIRLFANMTAVENAMVARHCRSKKGVVGAILRTRSQKREEAQIRADEEIEITKISKEQAVEVERSLREHRLTVEVEERRRLRNQVEKDTEIEIERKNLDAEVQSLEIAKEAEYARLKQLEEIAVRRAQQKAEYFHLLNRDKDGWGRIPHPRRAARRSIAGSGRSRCCRSSTDAGQARLTRLLLGFLAWARRRLGWTMNCRGTTPGALDATSSCRTTCTPKSAGR